METEIRQIHNFHEEDKFHEHYRLLEHVGSGGFADVWRAKDELVDTVVALKIYTRLDREGISELAKEYKDMRGIKHPNLLTGNHFDASGNIPYLEMDYCAGGSLYGRMGKMTNIELRKMLHDIASGLAYLHHEGIVHQDIKPENILHDTEHDRYLLSDFGISGKSRTRLSRSVNMANMTLSMTEAYAPPEKFSGNLVDIEPDAKGDLFSLGMTIFELATGVLPFTPPMATGREMLYSQGRLQVDYSKVEDPILRRIVEGCTRYNKTDRLTAEEVLGILVGKDVETKVIRPSETKDSGKKPTEKIRVNTAPHRDSAPPNLPTPPESTMKKNAKEWCIALLVVLALVLILLKTWSPTEKVEDWVDLGLPSGLLWATRNVGASSPTDYGNYYAWGETTPKSVYNWSTYRYCNGVDHCKLTKYCTNSEKGYHGYVDNLTTIQIVDDAAASYGDGARMPTKTEWQELKDNTTHTWTTRNGIEGFLFTGSNGNTLFLPAAGDRKDSSLCGDGGYGYYWSSKLFGDNPDIAWGCFFRSGSVDVKVDGWGNGYRRDGHSVRAVRSAD